MTKTNTVLLLACAFLLGCVSQSYLKSNVTPAQAEPALGASSHLIWEYHCESWDMGSRVTEKANQLGLDGFELVGLNAFPSKNDYYSAKACFKRQLH